jgi:DNA-binding NtrC family response regulator
MVFEALGRVFFCLDASFHVLHASDVLDEMLGEGTAESAVGQPIEQILSPELFGESGPIREALQAGERREGWRGELANEEKHHLVSLTAAPLPPDPVCEPRARYVVVVRPARDETMANDSPMAFTGIVARSPAMIRILNLVQSLRESLATVLITGDSGTGKEVVARALHLTSKRRRGPFIAVNCAALPADLLDSELFGHVKGAFTGAIRNRMGRFEEASEGTLFLDEIGDLPLHLQVKLLRVIQERSFQRVGENVTRTTEARIIAATNVDLKQAVEEGRFRDDLYYRLRVVPVHIPPLRERPEDIEPLARYLLAKVGRLHGRSLRYSPEALRALLNYSWPGNVREMINAIEFAVAVCRRQTILPEDLPPDVLRPGVEASASGGADRGREAVRAPAPPARPSPRPRGDSNGNGRTGAMEEEAAGILEALEAHRWHRGDTAKALGISRTTLWRKMREHGIDS